MSASKPAPVVAVVEDDASLRTALGRLLQAGGFEPALFESAEAYIDAAPEPLCLVVDVRLPGMSGIELQQRLRATGTAPPVIVTTASREAAVHERAQQNGCAGFFPKPVDGRGLIARIESLVNRWPGPPVRETLD
jgi:FixJ family two-component response regulator